MEGPYYHLLGCRQLSGLQGGQHALGFFMELRSTGRLVWPDTEIAKMPKASRMPHFTSVCPAGGCVNTFGFRA